MFPKRWPGPTPQKGEESPEAWEGHFGDLPCIPLFADSGEPSLEGGKAVLSVSATQLHAAPTRNRSA